MAPDYEYPRQFVASMFATLLEDDSDIRPSARMRMIKQHLPYCLVARNGDGLYLPLNREYKPLGWPTQRRAFLDYSTGAYDSFAVPVDDVRLRVLSRRETDLGVFHYFYGGEIDGAPWGGAAAMKAYQNRLRLIFNLPGVVTETGGANVLDR